jgi:hypothetical protein
MSQLPAGIFRRWVHSFEEDAGDVAVYRPVDYDFPLARGRRGIEFKRDGEFVEYSIGQTDAPLGSPGTWRSEGPNRASITFTDRPSAYTLEIVDFDGNLLKVRKSPSKRP